jgi:signal transduction histidine kinase
MPADDHASPLAASVLALIGREAAAADVEARLAQAGAQLAPGVAARLLDELTALGLLRVARGMGDTRRFVLTSLGRQVRRDGLLTGAAERLAELERLRTDLLSTMAHELRTPLTAVRTSVGLLLGSAAELTDEQSRSLLEAIERNAARMQRLVGDILDLTRFRTGQIRLQLRRFDPAELAREAEASIAPLARARRTTIALEAPEAAAPVYGDRRRLEQALVNLVSNAVRYSPEDGRVTIRVASGPAGSSWAVEDEGPGIPHEDQARLFERFFVGDSHLHGAHEGVGLGLPTALAVAQAHGGTIEVRSAPGEGSTFTLVVPTDGPEDLE